MPKIGESSVTTKEKSDKDSVKVKERDRDRDKHDHHLHDKHDDNKDFHEHSHGSCACGHCVDDCVDDDEDIDIDGCSCHSHGEHKNILEFPLNIPILCIGLVLLVISFIPQFEFMIRLVLAVIVYAYFGLPIISKMIAEIREGNIWNENTLMTSATVGAFCIGEFADAAAVMILYSFGEYLQDMAFKKSKSRIQEAILKNPDYANVIRNGAELKVNPKEVKVGEEIIVKPGEKIPLDGIIISGGAYADNSAVTGESAPVSLNIGDSALSGGILSRGTVIIRVDKPSSESTVSLIAKAMRDAGKRKSHTEKAITSFSKIYTPIVIAIAAVVVLFNIFIMQGEITASVKIGLVFLVISCPCALVLSVPLTYFAGLGAASRQGILIKGGESLDSAANVNIAVFDKTGTVTKADMEVEKIYAAKNIGNADSNEFIAKISAVLKNSNHPLCNSFTKKYKPAGKTNIEGFEEIAGKGVKGIVNGEKIICGNLEFLRESNIKIPQEMPKSSPTIIHCAVSGAYGGYISFTDIIKDGAYRLAPELKSLGISKDNIYLMSGDNKDAVSKVSAKIGIQESNYFHSLKPYEKMERLEKLIDLNKGKGKVMFVGDGLNDSAVLKRADVGIAVKKSIVPDGEAVNESGTYAAIDAADVVIMDGRIEKVAGIIKISKMTRRVVMQNIVFALVCKVAILLFNTFVYSSMELAILADVGVALLCVLNALRVL